MKYDKQPLDIPALLAMLKARGLTIGDEKQAGRLLGLVSYYYQNSCRATPLFAQGDLMSIS